MKKKWLVQISLAIFCLIFDISVQAGDIKVPASTGKVTDLVGLLSSTEVAKLKDDLNRFENSTSNEIGVLITDSLQGQSIEDYKFAVFNNWGIGKKGKDNGILIVLAPKEKKFGVEVGYGLGGVLPDIRAKEIADKYLVPKYREKKYYEAISGLVKQYEVLAAQEYAPKDGVEKKASRDNNMRVILFILVSIILVILAFLIIGVIINKRSRYSRHRYDGESSSGDLLILGGDSMDGSVGGGIGNESGNTRYSNRHEASRDGGSHSSDLLIIGGNPIGGSVGSGIGSESVSSNDPGGDRDSWGGGSLGSDSGDSGWSSGESGGGGCTGDL